MTRRGSRSLLDRGSFAGLRYGNQLLIGVNKEDGSALMTRMRKGGTTMRKLRAALVGGLAALLVGLAVMPAGATIIDRGTYSGTDSYVYDDCGYPVEVQAEFSGSYRVRAGKNGDQSAFFLKDTSSYRETHTNLDTGEWFVVRGQSVTNEIGATRVEGSVFEFVTVVAGQPFVVEDSSGNVVLRDRGAVRYRTLFDTGGDGEPGGTFLEFLGAEISGPHPGFFVDFCRIAGDLIGTGSSQRLTARPAGTTDSPSGYYEYLPPGYGGGERSPLLVFLHGFGENGDGSSAELGNLLATGIPQLIRNSGWLSERPFVVLAPQHANPTEDAPYAACEAVEHPGSCVMRIQHDLGHPENGSPCTTPAEVRDFLSYAIANYDVDPRRVYLTGLSCGAFGAWEYVAEQAGPQVAAMVPIAGDGRPAWETSKCQLGDVAIWAFHGDADDIVAPAGSIEPLTDLMACPAPPRRDAELTVYPGVDHDSWTRTYNLTAGHDIYNWLLGFTVP
ncbi:dienelactone hydrolase family protein [Kribbella sp. VKM Ac-2527]|uniref:Dienelactone hydrolase family protein n=2 Tax=Kribbella caucasensis TaxID=2512215 RepID=A0A4R6J046_9ACTN|nr:dienelactone hydrolase family protein [Kribbella sp. VKM Ac-2527]